MAATPYAGLSDLGRKRTRNDDRWGADPAQGLYMVADGVGSTSHGDIAAGLVVDTLPPHVARHLAGVDLRDEQATARLGAAVLEMCDHLYARSQTDPNLASADSTLVAAVMTESRAVIAHLGDSRAYLYRDRGVQRLTSDHTIVQAVVDAGEISEEEAAHHPNRSVVTRHVLMTPPAKPEVSALDLQPGDRILLCSDGLHGVVDDATIAAILTDHPNPADACRALIDAANHGGGPDNITAVVVHTDPVPPPARPGPGNALADEAPTVPAPTVQPRPADPNPPAPQQRSPGWQPPVPPAPPAGAPAPPAGAGPPQIGTPPPPPPLQPGRPRRRRGLKWGLILAVVVLILAAAGSIGYLLLWPHKSAHPSAPQASTGRPAPSSTQAVQPNRPAAPTQLPLGGGNHPEGVAVDTAGNIYVVIVIDEENARVVMLAAGTGTQSVLSFTGLRRPHGIAVDKAGNVYVTDLYEGGRVVALGPGSGPPTPLPFGETHGPGLRDPSGVAVDANGNVYVADTGNDRVVKLFAGTSSEEVLPFTGLERPSGVALDTTGNVYVTDRNHHRVLKLEVGSGIPVVLPYTGLEHPQGVAVDAAGNVYVTDSRTHQVVKLARSGTQSALSFTDLANPIGVAVDGGGSVYVADDETGRVMKLPAG
jgi:serine/threonine protein phosphatase PrpC/streptogramin lyase